MLALLFAVLCAALPTFAQSVVTTLNAVNGGPTVNGPTFLAIDPNRNIGGTTATWLYVSEHGATNNTGGGRILRYNLTSGATSADVVPVPSGTFTSPDAILVDSATGNLTIADRAQNRVVRISNSGSVLSTFGAGQLHGPVALATDSSGNTYVAEHGDTTGTVGAGGSMVSKWSSAGTRLWQIGGVGTGNGQFANTGPYGLTILNNTLYVTDGFNSRVQLFGLDGTYQSQFPIAGALPLGIYADPTGALWIAMGTNSIDGSGAIQEVRKYSASGTYANVTLAGGLNLPFYAVTSTSNLAYVSDYNNSRVVVFNLVSSGGGGVPVINSSATASGTVGQNFSYAITATNSPTSYAVDPSTPLPSGLSLSGSTIIGVPNVAGTTNVKLTASNGSGSSTAFNLAITIAPAAAPGGTAPTVTSFTYLPGSLMFRIQFSEGVTGVDQSDFTIATTGSVVSSISSVDPVSGDPSAYIINFTYNNQPPGSVAVAIKSSGTGITGITSGQAFAGGGVSMAVVPATASSDTTAPTVTGFTAGAPSGNTVVYTVTFSEGVYGLTPANFTVVPTGSAAGTVGTAINPTNTAGTVYTVPVTFTGTGTLALTIQGNGVIKDGNNNSYAGPDTSAAATVSGGSGGPTAAPVVSNATVAGQVGTAIAPVTVSATNSPSSFSAPGLSAYGLAINSGGVISGTPTSTASGSTVAVTATNAVGTSTPATITLNISAAPAGSAPVVSNATVMGQVGTAIAAVTVTATNAPTSFSAPGLAAYGLSINSSGVISGTPSQVAAGATVAVTATNATGTSTSATITLNITSAPANGVPVVSNVTVSGVVGVAITPVQVPAANSPTSFSSPGLAAYGLTISSSGVISGIPNAGAASTQVSVTASNGSGTSAPAAITLAILGGGGNTGGGGGNTGGGGVVTPPVKTSQTVTFAAPVSAIIINTPIQLGATASSGMAVTYSVVSGNATINGDMLTVTGSDPVIVRASQAGDATWVAASADITVTAQKMAQQVSAGSVPAKAYTDGMIMLNATSSSGLPVSYTVVSGPATITGSTLTFTGSGAVVVRAMQSGNDMYASSDTTFTINGSPIPRLINLSSRVRVTSNDSNGASIAGFVVTGASPKQILVRAVGPSLSSFGISTPLANPTLKLYDSKGAVVGSNTGWNNDPMISAADDAVGAFKLTAGSTDSAMLVTLAPGAYTAQVQSTTNSGTVLIEVYDVTANAAVPTRQLINISTRGTVGTGDDVLVGGFVVSGTDPKRVLVRAVGPGLAAYGVAGVLADPSLKLYDATGNLVAQDDNWGTPQAVGTLVPSWTAADVTAANTAAGAFPLTSGSTDSAIVITLNPGAYTAIVTGANGSSGAALMEIYELPTP